MNIITERIFFLNTQCKVIEDYKEQVNKTMHDYAYYKLVFNVLNSSFYKRFSKSAQMDFMKSCIFYESKTFFKTYIDMIKIFLRMKCYEKRDIEELCLIINKSAQQFLNSKRICIQNAMVISTKKEYIHVDIVLKMIHITIKCNLKIGMTLLDLFMDVVIQCMKYCENQEHLECIFIQKLLRYHPGNNCV